MRAHKVHRLPATRAKRLPKRLPENRLPEDRRGFKKFSANYVAEAADDARSPPDHPNDERADISDEDLGKIYQYAKLFVLSYEGFEKRMRRV